ncbi:hypothetical protein AciPR4_0117 [Terriglobus saanensis SP1PR4]|uniref:Uncharacterized protein n=2 Tax=Terriglobus saanensis TaxID=870903 RepID=E8UZ13_TERSS|nr:hypothetical protein AciPR4_0117 [Terriglobus saanensis SP1PR4]
MNSAEQFPSAEVQLSEIFGGYRAEWLKEKIFDLFTEPTYFPELKTSRPCVLIGGRGTGKTTVLRGLSYEGQYALSGQKASAIADWPYIGLYYRVNINRIAAFTGGDVSESEWARFFGHYVNLLLCDLILKFLDWYQVKTGSIVELPQKAYLLLGKALHFENVPVGLKDLGDALESVRTDFEAAVNNIADQTRLPMSIQGGPIDILLTHLLELPQFKGKTFFFLIDEYENLLEYQQQVINTLIKHSGEIYTFKIGVKELGFKTRTTLDPTQQLISPSDYVRIDITQKLSGEQFRNFALNVCNARMSLLHLQGSDPIQQVERLLPGLSEDEEANLLGIGEQIEVLVGQLTRANRNVTRIREIEPLRAYLIKCWAESRGLSVAEVYDDFLSKAESWDTRYSNYKHALLYNINRRKRGIRRYYAGWDVFTRLAASNIRYLLELVDQSLLLHYRKHGSLESPVSPEDQTLAAQAVGKKNLSELEGLSVSGAQLTKLLLGLGRVFGQMAEDSTGHAPEINQFRLGTENGEDEIPLDLTRVNALLDSAVMHLALVRLGGTKPGSDGDTREWDYMVHPIFSAFFVFSYRKKRRATLSPDDLLGLVDKPRETIREILHRHHRTEEPLPEQLRIFGAYLSDQK